MAALKLEDATQFVLQLTSEQSGKTGVRRRAQWERREKNVT